MERSLSFGFQTAEVRNSLKSNHNFFAVSPLEKIFGNIGLVMTPQYPAMPDKIYLNTPITVIPQAVDRAVNVKVILLI